MKRPKSNYELGGKLISIPDLSLLLDKTPRGTLKLIRRLNLPIKQTTRYGPISVVLDPNHPFTKSLNIIINNPDLKIYYTIHYLIKTLRHRGSVIMKLLNKYNVPYYMPFNPNRKNHSRRKGSYVVFLSDLDDLKDFIKTGGLIIEGYSDFNVPD